MLQHPICTYSSGFVLVFNIPEHLLSILISFKIFLHCPVFFFCCCNYADFPTWSIKVFLPFLLLSICQAVSSTLSTLPITSTADAPTTLFALFTLGHSGLHSVVSLKCITSKTHRCAQRHATVWQMSKISHPNRGFDFTVLNIHHSPCFSSSAVLPSPKHWHQ